MATSIISVTFKNLHFMHLYEIGHHEIQDSYPPVHGPIADWREALKDHPEQQKVFDILEPEEQLLVTRRLELQNEMRSAQEAVIHSKAVFDAIVLRRIKGELVDVSALEEARDAQSRAYARCLGVTAAVIDVESHLCMRNLPSEPYLWITQRRDGQALADGTAYNQASEQASVINSDIVA